MNLGHALSSEERAKRSANRWLQEQAADREARADALAAYKERQNALQRKYNAERAKEIARVRARQCPACFMVKTPSQDCDCTNG